MKETNNLNNKEMKATTILSFEKVSGLVKTQIDVEFGKNIKGQDYRNVNQINTANVTIMDEGDKFEDFQISLDEMIQVLKSEGYNQVN